jgi:hypothetical protein
MLRADSLAADQLLIVTGTPGLLCCAVRSAGMPSNDPECFGLLSRRPAAVVGKAQGPKAHVLVCAPSNAGA